MGGRAGAAANDNGIYFDVLATSYRDPQHYPDSRQIVEYFAHELHHVGLGRILDREQSHLHLNESGQCAFDLLRGLVMEGSASYLINGHRDLAFMRKSPMFTAAGDDSSRFTAVQRVLTGVLQQGWTRQQYEQTATQFDGNTLHITGATILDIIMRAQGRSAVMEVLRDPRQLLIRYNRSVRPQGGNFYFSGALARQVATLGK
jgi:hypothetical protein